MAATAVLAMILNAFKFAKKVIAFYKSMPDKNEALIPWLDEVDASLAKSEDRLAAYNPEKI
ncbi:hypothetical protein LCGC14_2372940 [marine sediment metagenome]|uniref:Uncharacterized protein n=1 Tax=marine sediment metagenome TaxID=412755 RepID=A0A0F9C383_9ZZZZ